MMRIHKACFWVLLLVLVATYPALAESDEVTDILNDIGNVTNAATPVNSHEIYVISVTLDTRAMALQPGGAGKQLHAAVLPENATDSRIYWMSSNESVATVDGNGYVTPRSPGITLITAETANQEKATCTVTVTDNLVTTLSISETELTLPEREAYVLTAELSPMSAENTDVTWISSDKSVAVVNQNGKVFSKAVGSCWISAIANGGLDIVARCKLTVTASDKPLKYVALTFDDGPCENTLDILDILDEYDVHVTFFTLGKLVDRYPNIIRKEAAHGHEVANHSYSHETLTKISLEKAKDEVDKADAAIASVLGYPAKICRAPTGSINVKTSTYIGKPFVDWTVDTNDWKYRDPEYIWKFIARNTGNCDIILMHDIRPTTMESLKKSVPYLLEQGFTFVTVSELLEIVGGVDESLIYNP